MVRNRSAARLHLLTVRELQAAQEGDHSDGGGLLLRVRDGSASWVFRYTSATGKRREMGLGSAHVANAKQSGASLSTARDLAHDARDLLARRLDPIDERDKARDATKQAVAAAKVEKARAQLTLARAARAYHERAIEPRLTTKHAAQWIAALENHIPAELWQCPIAEIDAPMLLAALSGVRSLEGGGHVPETLQRVRQRLDAVFEDAIFHGHCTTNPAAAIRRKMRETLPRKKAGKFAALPHREAPAFMAQLRQADGTAARCLEFAVLTGARTSEVLLLEWVEIDFEQRLWIVPAEKMKADEEHVVYLSPRALQVLEGMRGVDRRLVFPSTVAEGQPMSNMAMLAVLDRMGMRNRTTVHGLCRATFSTWANDTAVARPEVIEACLAHQERNLVRAAYNRAQFTEERRRLMDAWAAFLATPAADIIPLRAG
jgi:integrase